MLRLPAGALLSRTLLPCESFYDALLVGWVSISEQFSSANGRPMTFSAVAITGRDPHTGFQMNSVLRERGFDSREQSVALENSRLHHRAIITAEIRMLGFAWRTTNFSHYYISYYIGKVVVVMRLWTPWFREVQQILVANSSFLLFYLYTVY